MTGDLLVDHFSFTLHVFARSRVRGFEVGVWWVLTCLLIKARYLDTRLLPSVTLPIASWVRIRYEQKVLRRRSKLGSVRIEPLHL